MVVSAALLARGVRAAGRLPSHSRPRDEPRVHASGIDSDRVLLYGTGVSVGWGVKSHRQGLGGALAEALSQATGRGADVDIVCDPGFTASNSASELEDVRMWRYDAIVVTLGLNEALRFGSITEWRTEVDQLLDFVTSGKSRYATLYLVGLDERITLGPFGDGSSAQLRAAMNQVSSQLSEQGDRARFVPAAQVGTLRRDHLYTGESYRAYAEILAAAIAPDLDRGFAFTESEARNERAGGHDELSRQRAVDALGIANDIDEERFDRIVAMAKATFGTQFAAMTVIDGERQWHKSGLGGAARNISRDSSVCATTIHRAGALIVSDLSMDGRFSQLLPVEGDEPVKFYAGFPIEAPTGERIGALCVFDTEAREIADIDQARLRDFALMAQAEVWNRAAELRST